MKSNIQNFIKASGVTVVRDARARPPPIRAAPTRAMPSSSSSLSPPRPLRPRAMSASPVRTLRASPVKFKTPQKNHRQRAPPPTVSSPPRPRPIKGNLVITPFEYKLVNLSSKQAGEHALTMRPALVKRPKLTFEPISHGNRTYRVRVSTTYAMRGMKSIARHDAGIEKIAGDASEQDITNLRFRIELVDEKSQTYTVDVYAYKTGTVRITAAVPKDDIGVLHKVRDWVIFNYLPRRKILLAKLELKSVNAQWKHNGTFTPSTAMKYLHTARTNALTYEPEMKQYFLQFKIREHTVQLYPGGTVALTGARSLEAVKRGYAAANVVLYQMFRDGVIHTSNAPFASPKKRPVKTTQLNAPNVSWVGSELHVGSRKCTSKLVKKSELVAVAKSLGVMHEKMKKYELCAEIQRAFVKNGSPVKNKRTPSRPDLTDKGIRDDLIGMYGKSWMSSYGKLARKDLVSDVKNVKKAIGLLAPTHTNVYGQPKKTVVDAVKKYLVRVWKDLRRERYTREILFESIVV
jgi:hypothetical protein